MELEDIKAIKAIIDLMKKNDLSFFELEKEGFKLKLQMGPNGQPMIMAPAALASSEGAQAAASPTAAPAEAPGSSPLKDIVSPMVGTFFRSASPEAAPFAEIGKSVNEESVVCIIEAMKVMNEIKAETSGVIAEVVAENGKPVQFGQVLFRVR